MLGREQTNGTDTYDPSGIIQHALEAWSLPTEAQAALDISTPPREHVYLWIMRLPPSVNPREAAKILLDVTKPPPSTQNSSIEAFSFELRCLLEELYKTPETPKRRRGGRNARLTKAKVNSTTAL